MAACRSGSSSSSSSSSSSRLGASYCCLLLLLLLLGTGAVRVAAAAAEAVSLGAKCDSMDACRAGVANDACCRAINAAILRGTCSRACLQLKNFGNRNLAADCSKKPGCPQCGRCKCTQLPEESASISGM